MVSDCDIRYPKGAHGRSLYNICNGTNDGTSNAPNVLVVTSSQLQRHQSYYSSYYPAQRFSKQTSLIINLVDLPIDLFAAIGLYFYCF